MFTSRFTRCIVFAALAFLVGVAASAQYHTADTTPNQVISLTELLRVIQFYNSGGLHCMDATEDGYAPGLDSEQQSCIPHDSDYVPVDWKVNLTELLRLIQFYNLRGYSLCLGEATEDGYCPNASPAENPTAAFTASDTTGYAPRAIRFVNESEVGQGTVVSWEWTFGDGGTSTEPEPIYTYESPGVYDVTLTLTTTMGTANLTKSEYITLGATNAEGTVFVLAPETGWTLVKQENGDFEVTEITKPKSEVIIETGDYVVGRATSEETGHLFQYLGSKRNLAEEARSKISLIIPATTVGHAAISDLVEQGSIAVYFEITEADLERSGIPLLKSTEKGVSVDLSGKRLYNAGGLRVEIVQGSLNFDLGGDFVVDLGFFKVDRVRAMLKGRLDLEATLLVSASIDFDFSNEIVLLPPVRIPVTAVVAGAPVWIEILLEFKGGFDLDVGGSVLSTSGFLNQTELRLGAEYRDGDWYDLTRFDSRTRGKQPTLALNSYLNARLYVRPELQVKLYSTAVPYLAAEPYLDMHGDFSPPSGQVDIGMGMDAILGFSLEILNFTVADWDKSYDVWHRPLYTLYPPAPQDLEPPVITLLGNQTMTVECGTPFTDPGATALDNVDGNITGSIVNGGTVNTSEPDVYTRTYDVMDSAGNPAVRMTRTVTVQDTAAPVISLLGSTAMTLECGGTFNDPGATATDTCAGNLTSSITRTGTVNTADPGEYILYYDVSDDSGHAGARRTRTVTVEACEGEGIAEGEGAAEGEGEGDDEGVAEGEGDGEDATIMLPGGVPLEMVWIPAGTFMMGGNDTGHTSHEVTLTKGFWLGKYEVTQRQWDAIMGVANNPSSFRGDGSLPVESASWNDIYAVGGFLEGLNIWFPVGGFRLPTEAEWEYACRSGTDTSFYWGEHVNDSITGQFAWFYANSENKTHAVGHKQPNSWGLYDMSGNVQEFCSDWYYSTPSIPVVDPVGPPNSMGGYGRVIRGGSWNYIPINIRSAHRDNVEPSVGYNTVGLRLARTP